MTAAENNTHRKELINDLWMKYGLVWIWTLLLNIWCEPILPFNLGYSNNICWLSTKPRSLTGRSYISLKQWTHYQKAECIGCPKQWRIHKNNSKIEGLSDVSSPSIYIIQSGSYQSLSPFPFRDHIVAPSPQPCISDVLVLLPSAWPQTWKQSTWL